MFVTFRNFHNNVVTLCRQSKAKYFADYFHQNSKHIRKIWKGFKEIMSLKLSSKSKPISLRIDGIVTSNPDIVANSFTLISLLLLIILVTKSKIQGSIKLDTSVLLSNFRRFMLKSSRRTIDLFSLLASCRKGERNSVLKTFTDIRGCL